MKGLLIKDFKLLKNQKQFFVVIGVISIMLLLTNENPSFTITYTTMMFSMFTMSTISYDEYDNGAVYLFSLPITRKGYVAEKYTFGMITSLFIWIVITVLSYIVGGIRKIEVPLDELAVISMAALVVVSLVLSVSIPLQLKFGVEKSRMAFIAVFALAFVVAVAAIKLAEWSSIDISTLLEKMSHVSFGAGMIVLLILAAAMLGISGVISLRIMEKREF